MLRKSTKNWLSKEKMLREKVTEPHAKTTEERVKEHRIRKTATRAIQDLTFLLEILPEEQLEQVFSVENMQSFLQALLSIKEPDVSEKKRKRLTGLWKAIFAGTCSYAYAKTFVGEDVLRALINRPDATFLQAIYYATLFKE
jgi:hypothetical protein